MRIWLVQRAESTPHDDDGNRRLLRIGILADILQEQGHEVVWWTSSFDHVGKKKRYQQSTRVKVKKNWNTDSGFINSLGVGNKHESK